MFSGVASLTVFARLSGGFFFYFLIFRGFNNLLEAFAEVLKLFSIVNEIGFFFFVVAIDFGLFNGACFEFLV